ncbi:MAG: hypothetical protein V3W45_07585 [Sedimentisphaerales bacterium]
MFYRLPDWLRYEIQHRWERTGINIREWINANSRIIIGITFASVLILLVIVICMLMPEETIKVEEYDKEWFYDLNTGQLFVAKSDAVVPIEAPSGELPQGGPAGVRAYVFSYSDEPNEANRFIGFLEIPDPNAKDDKLLSLESTATGAELWGQGRLICRVGDEQWVSANSAKGRAILRGLFHPNAKGEVAHYCPPE